MMELMIVQVINKMAIEENRPNETLYEPSPSVLLLYSLYSVFPSLAMRTHMRIYES